MATESYAPSELPWHFPASRNLSFFFLRQKNASNSIGYIIMPMSFLFSMHPAPMTCFPISDVKYAESQLRDCTQDFFSYSFLKAYWPNYQEKNDVKRKTMYSILALSFLTFMPQFKLSRFSVLSSHVENLPIPQSSVQKLFPPWWFA